MNAIHKKILLTLFFLGVSTQGVCNTSPTFFVPASPSPTIFAPNPPRHSHSSSHSSSKPIITRNNFPQGYHNNHRNYHHQNNAVVYPYVTYEAAPVVNDDAYEEDGYVRNMPDNDVNREQTDTIHDAATSTNGKWVDAHDGELPDNAVPYTDANDLESDSGESTGNVFYCRGVYNNEIYDGILVPDEGCYVDDRVNAATIRLQNYQVLTNP